MRKIRSIWSFILHRKAGNSSAPTRPSDSPSGNWYSTLDLPLDRFIRCLVDGDLSALIISKRPSNNELFNAWESIYEQFLDAMNDKNGLYKVRLLNKINLLEFDYELAQMCIKFLKKGHTNFVETSLRRIVRVDTLDPSDKTDYLRKLQIADNWTRRMKFDLDTYRAEYTILEKKVEGGVAVSHEYFRNLVTQVSFFMKFRINPREITTSEFTGYYSMMKETNDLIRQQQNAKK